jgi:phage shock protein E
VIYLDVRTKEEFVAGAKDGALHHDIMQMFEGIFPELARDTEITVYCQSGNRSMMAKTLLEHAGFSAVTDGGGVDSVI